MTVANKTKQIAVKVAQLTKAQKGAVDHVVSALSAPTPTPSSNLADIRSTYIDGMEFVYQWVREHAPRGVFAVFQDSDHLHAAYLEAIDNGGHIPSAFSTQQEIKRSKKSLQANLAKFGWDG